MARCTSQTLPIALSMTFGVRGWGGEGVSPPMCGTRIQEGRTHPKSYRCGPKLDRTQPKLGDPGLHPEERINPVCPISLNVSNRNQI